MQIGKTWDYDPASNTWITLDDVNDQWLIAFIHTLRSDPAQHLFYADHGVSALTALQTHVMPTADVTRTQQQFSPYFARLTPLPASDVEPIYNIQYQYFNGTTSSKITDLSKYK
jgi:hypothetical protein